MRTSFVLALLGLSIVPTRGDAAAPPMPADPLPPGVVARLGYARMVLGQNASGLQVSTDGRWIVSDGRWWCDLRDGNIKPTPLYIPENCNFNCFLAHGSYVVYDKATFELYLLTTGSRTPRIRIPAWHVDFEKQYRFCVQIDAPEGQKARLLLGDLRPGGLIRNWKVIATLDSAPYRLSMSDDGGRILWKEDQTDRFGLYDVASGKLTTFTPRLEQDESVRYPALSPDSKIAAALGSGCVFFYDGRTGKFMRRIDLGRFRDWSEGWFTPDNKTLVIPSYTDGLMVVPVDPNKPPYKLTLDKVRRAYSHVLMPDSRRIAVGDGDGVIRLFDLHTGKQVDHHSRFPYFDGVQMIGHHTIASSSMPRQARSPAPFFWLAPANGGPAARPSLGPVDGSLAERMFVRSIFTTCNPRNRIEPWVQTRSREDPCRLVRQVNEFMGEKSAAEKDPCRLVRQVNELGG